MFSIFAAAQTPDILHQSQSCNIILHINEKHLEIMKNEYNVPECETKLSKNLTVRGGGNE